MIPCAISSCTEMATGDSWVTLRPDVVPFDLVVHLCPTHLAHVPSVRIKHYAMRQEAPPASRGFVAFDLPIPTLDPDECKPPALRNRLKDRRRRS